MTYCPVVIRCSRGEREFVEVLRTAVVRRAVNGPEVRRRWAERSGEYSPDYYAHYGPNETSEVLRGYLDSHLDTEATILELGCSSGRHLAHLADHGYENLHGIDINDDALDVLSETYPDLADRGTFYIDAIENVLPGFADGQFDAVYSVETLQHIHPESEWVFEDLCRITSDLLLTVENESGRQETDDATDPAVNYVRDDFPLYYRDWAGVFTDLGLHEIDSNALDRDTLRVFKHPDAVLDGR